MFSSSESSSLRASKAGALNWLAPRVRASSVPELLSFTISSWIENPTAIVSSIRERFVDDAVAVRSSAVAEDGVLLSSAGVFESVLDVNPSDPVELASAIERVADSYAASGARDRVLAEDEVLVQRMVSSSVLSGVVFTHDLDSGAPYFVINYDDRSGATNSVTTGVSTDANRTLYVHRSATEEVRSERFARLLAAVAEVEELMASEFLDIEFAMGEDLVTQLLQVRAITTKPNWNRGTTRQVDATLAGVQRFVVERFGRHAGVFGSTTVFGQMPDWNPAELIGRAPRALAHSLYTTLVTDSAWARGRELMGYAVPIEQPLVVSLANQPFVDTRLSFNSFLPAEIDPSVAEELVNVWVQRLADHPQLHDKVEFDVAVTAYRFDLPERVNELTGGVLSANERDAYVELVREHTLSLLRTDAVGGVSRAQEMVARLAAWQEGQDPLTRNGSAARIRAMVVNTIRLGTVPFAILARHAFIAKTLLHSLVTCQVLSIDQMRAFESGLRTVASDLVDDIARFREGSLEREAFMAQYGFLRPGTYDILSLRYDQMPLFEQHEATVTSAIPPETTRKAGPGSHEWLSPEEPQMSRVDELLQAHEFGEFSGLDLFAYAEDAIVGREYAKFVFSRTVSDLLEAIADFGRQHHLSREELSHLRLQDLVDIFDASVPGEVEDVLRERASASAATHEVTAMVRLPQVLFDVAGVHVVPFQVSAPNFITSEQVTAPTVLLSGSTTSTLDPPVLSGRVALIEGADPGYDWIFSYPIAGLATKYGGANSHMAIRCAEFGLPAAIGCGEQHFTELSEAAGIVLDCAARIVKPVHTL